MFEAKKIEAKAKLLVDADCSVNGYPRNAPYVVEHDGELFKVKVARSKEDEATHETSYEFVIVRPETVITHFNKVPASRPVEPKRVIGPAFDETM